MQFSVLRENLNSCLLTASRFLSTKNAVPVLTNFLFSADKKQLTVSAINLESGISFSLGATISKEGQICIPAKTLIELSDQLPAGKVDFVLEGERIKISAGGVMAQINTVLAEDFPPVPKTAKEKNIFLEREVFLDSISNVVFSAGQDEGKPVLSGVKILEDEGSLVFVATDGYRLSLAKTKTKNPFLREIILPAKTLSDLLRILKEQDDEKIIFESDEKTGQVIFSFQKGDIFCREISGNYPDFKKIIPRGFTTRVVLDREEFLRGVKTAAVFARESASIIKFEIRPSAGSGSKFEIKANAPQVGEDTVEIGARTEGEDGEIAFNYRFVLDFLNNTESEEVVFEMNGALSPGVFKLAGDDSFVYVVMPVRVQQ